MAKQQMERDARGLLVDATSCPKDKVVDIPLECQTHSLGKGTINALNALSALSALYDND